MADLQTDEIEAGIKRLINFNSESGSLSISVLADQKHVSDTKNKNKGRKSPKTATDHEKSKYCHEKGIAASCQDIVDTLLPKNDSEKKASHKRRSDGDIFTETPRVNSSKKSEYGPQKVASAEVMEGRVILKAKRRHHQESPEKLPSVSKSSDGTKGLYVNIEKNVEVPNGENAVKPKANVKEDRKNMKVSKQSLLNTKLHHRQESPEVSDTKGPNVNQSEAVRKFLEIPELKSKKKKKKKPKKKADDKLDQKEEVGGSDEIEEKESDNGEKKTIPELPDAVDIKGNVPTQKMLENLEKERIFPLKKKSLRFPRAMYFCRLCDYHMDTVLDCDKHIRDSRHSRRKEIFHIEAKLSKLPPTTADQVLAVDELVDRIYEEFALTDQEMEYRLELSKNLQTFLNKSLSELKDITLVLYGSSKSGFGLKDSDVNIDLLVQGEQNQARALTLAYKVMKESEHYTEVKSDFSAKLPCVYFRDTDHSLNCQLTISGALAPKTTNLLTIYSQLDSRVRKLGIVMRHFAKICKIDKQEEGTLPSYCYAMMVVYYLQQCKPCILPVLSKATEVPTEQEEARSPTKKKKSPSPADLNIDNVQESMCWKSESTESVGSLWIGLLRFYSLDFDNSTSVISIRQKAIMSRAEKKWNTKRIAIEDPFSTKRNTARSVTSYEVFQYIWDCFRKAYFYFSLPTNYDQLTQKQKHLLHFQKSKAKKNNARPSNQDIRSSDSLSVQETKSAKDCGKQDFNIDTEDADNSSDSVVILSEEEIDEEEECKSVTVDDDNKDDNYEGENLTKHFTQNVDSIQEDDAGHLCGQTDSSQGTPSVVSDLQSNVNVNIKGVTKTLEKLVMNSGCDSCQKEQESCEDTSPSGQTMVRDTSPSSDQKLVRDLVNEVVHRGIALLNLSAENDTGQGHLHGDGQEAETNSTPTRQEMADTIHHGGKQEAQINSTSELVQGGDEAEIPVKGKPVSESLEHMPPLQYEYVFAENSFTDGKGPLVVCSICDKEGHLKSSCPDETLPDLKPLPAMPKKSMQMLTETIKQVPRDFGLTSKEYKDRESIRKELEDFIRELYPVAELHLFGSSDNGFGFKQSDLDLCVTFSDKKTCEGLDLVGIIEEIAKKLKTHKGLYNVFPITTAKVPIVKFRHRWSQLEGDISLYNLLALHNTRMIMMYSRLDARVRSLGYALKVFAKVCDIGDASRGSLSSYAYVLMLIYYLQQCRPPVLPVLQELYPGKDRPERIVDGWNAWYFDNESQLPKIFRTKNNQSVGELWMGLFTFYTEEFSLKDHVVCIRQRELLTRFEKLWNGKCIAIEDPFDLSHNLGGGLSRKMNQYIMKALIHGRLLYGTPIQGAPPENLSDYFFDKAHLTEGNPPNDRCCRVCSKIGHIARECPRLQLKKERDEKRKEEKRLKEDKRRKDKEEQKKYEEQRNQQKVIRRSGSDPQDREYQSYQRQNVMYTRSISNPGQLHPSQRMPNSPSAERQNLSYNRPNQGHNQPMHQGGYGFNPQMYNCGPVPVHFQGNRTNSGPANMRPPGFVSNQQRPMSPGKAHFVNQQQRHPWVQQYLPTQTPSHPNMNIPVGTPRQQGPAMNPSNQAMPSYGNDMYPGPGPGQRMREPQQVYRPPHQRRK